MRSGPVRLSLSLSFSDSVCLSSGVFTYRLRTTPLFFHSVSLFFVVFLSPFRFVWDLHVDTPHVSVSFSSYRSPLFGICPWFFLSEECSRFIYPFVLLTSYRQPQARRVYISSNEPSLRHFARQTYRGPDKDHRSRCSLTSVPSTRPSPPVLSLQDDGKLSFEEFEAFLGRDVPDETLRALFDDIDTDRSGNIDLSELTGAFHS